MISQEVFTKHLVTLLTFKQVDICKIHNDALYGLLKADFTDLEFMEACERITKQKNLYNKYPDPSLFYENKKQKKPEDIGRYIPPATTTEPMIEDKRFQGIAKGIGDIPKKPVKRERTMEDKKRDYLKACRERR